MDEMRMYDASAPYICTKYQRQTIYADSMFIFERAVKFNKYKNNNNRR